MVSTAKTAVLLVAAVSTMAIAALVTSKGAFASTGVPLGITPVCSSADRAISAYQVSNQNDTSVTVNYRNAANGAIGTFTAAPGESNAYVSFDPTESDNTTSFTYDGGATKTEPNFDNCDISQLPALAQACADGSNLNELAVDWSSSSQLSIWTRTRLPFCDDVTLYYSTYSMPDTYDNNGFYTDPSRGILNVTSVPQDLQTSIKLTLKAGLYGLTDQTVPVPNLCYNTQADVYYGPEVTSLGADGLGYHADGTPVPTSSTEPLGHGTQYVASQLYPKATTSTCGPIGRGGDTGGTTPVESTGNVSTQSAPITAALPIVLPNTGVNDLGQNVASTVLTMLFGGIGLLGLGVRALRQK
jgi:hypothetical protein